MVMSKRPQAGETLPLRLSLQNGGAGVVAASVFWASASDLTATSVTYNGKTR
jgi:hypothetical protein